MWIDSSYSPYKDYKNFVFQFIRNATIPIQGHALAMRITHSSIEYIGVDFLDTAYDYVNSDNKVVRKSYNIIDIFSFIYLNNTLIFTINDIVITILNNVTLKYLSTINKNTSYTTVLNANDFNTNSSLFLYPTSAPVLPPPTPDPAQVAAEAAAKAAADAAAKAAADAAAKAAADAAAKAAAEAAAKAAADAAAPTPAIGQQITKYTGLSNIPLQWTGNDKNFSLILESNLAPLKNYTGFIFEFKVSDDFLDDYYTIIINYINLSNNMQNYKSIEIYQSPWWEYSYGSSEEVPTDKRKIRYTSSTYPVFSYLYINKALVRIVNNVVIDFIENVSIKNITFYSDWKSYTLDTISKNTRLYQYPPAPDPAQVAADAAAKVAADAAAKVAADAAAKAAADAAAKVAADAAAKAAADAAAKAAADAAPTLGPSMTELNNVRSIGEQINTQLSQITSNIPSNILSNISNIFYPETFKSLPLIENLNNDSLYKKIIKKFTIIIFLITLIYILSITYYKYKKNN